MKWIPHPGPQEKALQRSEYEILFGGSRGPGKTDAGLVWLTDHLTNPRFRALVIRKNADDLSDWVDRAARMYGGFGVKVAYRPPILSFPSGAIIKTGHLKDDQAYTKYQGHEYQRILIEELTQIPDEKRYLQLLASCRSTIPDIKPQIFCTTNPGGVGHSWVKKRWRIDEYPLGSKPFNDPTSGRLRIFIKATVDDNPTLMQIDPGYVNFLESLKDTDVELWKAWRNGDWNTFAGQYFKEWSPNLHIMDSFTPKGGLYHIGGLDWGRTDPFCFLPSIILPITYEDILDGTVYKFYRVITYREFYGTDKSPKEWSQIITPAMDKMGVPISQLTWIQADNQIFNPQNDNSISIADQFYQDNLAWQGKLKAASKERIGGWENMHNWLSLAPDGLPYWLITANCTNLIASIPELIHDDNIVEDVNHQSSHDHAPDAARYMLKALKWIDAYAGAVRHHGGKPPTKLKTISRVAMVNTDDFAIAVDKRRDWRAI
jgi:phage terminase large subunit